jgi:hypothetical protein
LRAELILAQRLGVPDMRALNLSLIPLNLALYPVTVDPAGIAHRTVLGHVAAKVGRAIRAIPVLRALKALSTLAVSLLLRVLSVPAGQ